MSQSPVNVTDSAIHLELSEAQARHLWSLLRDPMADEIASLRHLYGREFIKAAKTYCAEASAADNLSLIERRNMRLLAQHFQSVCELLELLLTAMENPGRKLSANAAPKVERLLCKADEACEILGGISKATLWRWVQAGHITTIQGLGNTLYPIAGLRRFANGENVVRKGGNTRRSEMR